MCKLVSCQAWRAMAIATILAVLLEEGIPVILHCSEAPESDTQAAADTHSVGLSLFTSARHLGGIVFEFLDSTIQNTFHYLEHFSLSRTLFTI